MDNYTKIEEKTFVEKLTTHLSYDFGEEINFVNILLDSTDVATVILLFLSRLAMFGKLYEFSFSPPMDPFLLVFMVHPKTVEFQLMPLNAPFLQAKMSFSGLSHIDIFSRLHSP